MTRILGLGDNTIDTYVDAGMQYPGGNAVNVAVMTARLGAKSAYLGCLGDDDGGRLLRHALTAEGIDLSRVRTRRGDNARAFIGHVGGDRHFLRSSPGVRADYQWEASDFDYIAQFDHVHTSIYSDLDDVFPRIAAHARSISLDASNRWSRDHLREVLPHVRFVFLSAADLDAAACQATANDCLTFGVEAVVMTRGASGALGMNAEGSVLNPAPSTGVVDTLGAGDGFISGFLMAMLAGGDLQHAMREGARFAAQVCGWHGAFGHAAPWAGKPHADTSPVEADQERAGGPNDPTPEG